MQIAKAVQSWKVRPFEYGTADCCAFCAFVVEAMTGKSYLPVYSDHEALLRLYGGLSGAVSEYVGPPVDVANLKSGDLVLLSVFDQESLGVVVDDAHAVTLLQNGMPRLFSMAFADKGWSV